jgi:hypothetical protein
MLMLIVGGSFVAGSDNPHDGIDAAGGRPPHLSDWGFLDCRVSLRSDGSCRLQTNNSTAVVSKSDQAPLRSCVEQAT